MNKEVIMDDKIKVRKEVDQMNPEEYQEYINERLEYRRKQNISWAEHDRLKRIEEGRQEDVSDIRPLTVGNGKVRPLTIPKIRGRKPNGTEV